MNFLRAVICFSCCSMLFAEDSMDSRSKKSQPTLPVLQHCSPKPSHFSCVNFEVFGQWLFLQPNGSSIYYAAEAFPFNTAIAIPEVSPNWKIFEIDPSYHSGFEVGSKFLFPKNAVDLEVNWERLHTSDSDSMNVTAQSYGTGNMVGPFFDIGPNSAVYKAAKGKASFHFDAVNVIVGKKVCFLDSLSLHFYTGASMARIRQSIFSFFSNSNAQSSRSVYALSKFIGAGPEFGVDFDYRLIGSFSFIGESSMALYMGQLKNHTTYKSTSPDLSNAQIPQPNKQRTSVPNRSQLIPSFEEKLGFSYAVSSCKYQFTLSAGYQFQIYLDAVQSVDMTAPQVLPSLTPGASVNMGVYAVGFERTLSNFILTGPFVSANANF